MYVCICNAITDSEIRGAVDLGARSLDDLSSTLGVATCCRRCADCARCVLDDHLASAQRAAPAKPATARPALEHGSADHAQYSAQGAD